MSGSNSIKEEPKRVTIGNLSGPGGSGLVRLQPSQGKKPSLKSSQDSKPQKKTFAPTISTDRRIKKEPALSVERPANKPGKTFNNDKKGRRKEKRDIIKSNSVFSMGPAGKSSRITSGTTARASDNFDLIKKRPKNDEQVKLIKENKQEQMEELDCIPSQSDLIEFFSSSALPPCQLPLESSRSQSTAAQLLTTAHSTLDGHYLFMQVPDSLPIAAANPSSKDPGSSEKADISRVHEGFVGKLRIHKSGRVSLCLGGVSLDVSMGTPCGFLQELVCIHSCAPDLKMTAVGHLSHRLICTPDFENMLSSDHR